MMGFGKMALRMRRRRTATAKGAGSDPARRLPWDARARRPVFERPALWVAHAQCAPVTAARPSMIRKTVYLLVALVSFLLALAPSSAGADEAAAHEREYLIKAAFLFNFARFTQWPASAFDPGDTGLRMCVLGEDPFGPVLDGIAGKIILGRAVVVERMAEAGAAQRCHLLFVGASEAAGLKDILTLLDGLPILTIADMPGFAKSGGIINLKTVDNKVRFEINVLAAQRAGLRFSSKVLKLADLVSSQGTREPVDAQVR